MCAYGCEELQPGSSRNTPTLPGVCHCLKRMMWSELLTASPGWSDSPGTVCETAVLNGANCVVMRPGAGRPHAHETNPEQSERYGSQFLLSCRLQVDEHAES